MINSVSIVSFKNNRFFFFFKWYFDSIRTLMLMKQIRRVFLISLVVQPDTATLTDMITTQEVFYGKSWVETVTEQVVNRANDTIVSCQRD